MYFTSAEEKCTIGKYCRQICSDTSSAHFAVFGVDIKWTNIPVTSEFRARNVIVIFLGLWPTKTSYECSDFKIIYAKSVFSSSLNLSFESFVDLQNPTGWFYFYFIFMVNDAIPKIHPPRRFNPTVRFPRDFYYQGSFLNMKSKFKKNRRYLCTVLSRTIDMTE